MPRVEYQNLGLISYEKAWDYQKVRLKEVIDLKLGNRHLPDAEKLEQKSYLLFCHHPPVYTLGKTGSLDNLLLNEAELKAAGIEFFKINRGGDITFHGPNQLIGYPIFDMDCFFTDIHKYVRFLEEVIIRTLAEYDVEAYRIPDYTGVWLPPTNTQPKRKICAIGVHLSRWVTMHGFAFNVNTDLSYFNNIIPCGIQEDDKTVTSLAAELERLIDMDIIKQQVKKHFKDLFEFEFV